MNGDLVWGGNCIYIYRRANSFRPKIIRDFNAKLKLQKRTTNKDIALLFGFRYLNVASRFTLMITLKKKRYCSVQFSWSAKLTWEERKLLENSTIIIIIIRLYMKIYFLQKYIQFWRTVSVCSSVIDINENCKEYSKLFVEWSAHKNASFYTRGPTLFSRSKSLNCNSVSVLQ